MEDCIFCQIADHKIPAEIVYEDDNVIFFKDISPQAPVHLLGITRKHIASISDMEKEDEALIGSLMSKISDIVKDLVKQV